MECGVAGTDKVRRMTDRLRSVGNWDFADYGGLALLERKRLEADYCRFGCDFKLYRK